MDRNKFKNYMLLNDHYMQMAAQNPFYRENISQGINNNSVKNNSTESININSIEKHNNKEKKEKEHTVKILPFKIR